jgi:hypothetical protein
LTFSDAQLGLGVGEDPGMSNEVNVAYIDPFDAHRVRHRAWPSLVRKCHYGDRLTGCLECNLWKGDKSAFVVELEVEDWEALGKLRNSTKWTLRHKKNLG